MTWLKTYSRFSGIIRPSEMPSLFGRLQFCEAQLLGRQGRLAMADLRLLERSRENRVKIGSDQQDSFRSLLERLKNAKPRTIFASPPCPPVLVFTDGACEPDGDSFAGSIGGVLVVPTNGEPTIKAFGCHLPAALMDLWAKTGKKHLIGPVELYAVCLARRCWSEFLHNRVIFFVDHGGVLASLITGASRDATWRKLLLTLEQVDSEVPCLSWFARVPSQSNISDGPSRGDWSALKNFSFIREHPECLLTKVELLPT